MGKSPEVNPPHRPVIDRSMALRYLAGAFALPLAGCEGASCFPVPASTGSPRTPTQFGAQIYSVDDVEKAIEAIANGGGTCVRVGLDFGYAFSDAVVAAAARRGIRVIFITPFAPQPVVPDLFAATCATIQLRYAKYAPAWEIWNEPNLESGWGAPPNVENYAALAITTAKALRQAGARHIWSGGTSGIDIFWIARLRRLGVYDVVNGCAVHSYIPPCEAFAQYAQLRGVLPSNVSIHTTETCVPTDQDQVGFLQQMWYVHRILGLPTMVWCELRDRSAGTTGPYAYPYGLLYQNYAPKPSFAAAKALIAGSAG